MLLICLIIKINDAVFSEVVAFAAKAGSHSAFVYVVDLSDFVFNDAGISDVVTVAAKAESTSVCVYIFGADLLPAIFDVPVLEIFYVDCPTYGIYDKYCIQLIVCAYVCGTSFITIAFTIHS